MLMGLVDSSSQNIHFNKYVVAATCRNCSCPLNDGRTLFGKASLWQPPASEVLSWEVCECRNFSSQPSLSTVSRSGNCFWSSGLVMSISGKNTGQTLNRRYGDKWGLRASKLAISVNSFNLWEGNICYKEIRKSAAFFMWNIQNDLNVIWLEGLIESNESK